MALLLNAWIVPPALATQATFEEQVREIAAELRCVVCQNLSVADSPSELAEQMRGVIRKQLEAGKTPDEIKSYFVSKYGTWVLLAPPRQGFSLLLWVLPFVALAAGIGLFVFFVRRWTRQKDESGTLSVDPDLRNPRSLLQEQVRLHADLRELEFDYRAGKLSEADYRGLREKVEARVALVLRELGGAEAGKREPAPAVRKAARWRGWRLAAGGAFLVLFGLTLGFFLSQSLRLRRSDQESITGDFMTGTRSELSSRMAEGRAAFDRKQWPEAIAAFKEALVIDPNHPEAHAYMGLILAQAGHAEGALLAFDRALSADPNLPIALWGKGMILYRVKEDLGEARATLERLARLMPQGAEKNEIEKTIFEIDREVKGSRAVSPKTGLVTTHIRGVVALDPSLKKKVSGQAVLFVIARAANAEGGPPLAVKKIDRPVFPVRYSLGPEDTMMPGRNFSGKLRVSARLDRDGNPMTREEGDLAGEYKKNPVEVGSQNVDIVIDQPR